MGTTIWSRMARGWNAFRNADSGRNAMSDPPVLNVGVNNYFPGLTSMGRRVDKSIINSVYNQIANDVCSAKIKHVYVDANGRYENDVENSYIDSLFNLEANIDQTGTTFLRDVVISMFTEGTVAIVPVDTDIDPRDTEAYKIESLRTGKVTQWFTRSVEVEVYNDRTGLRERIIMPKNNIALIENPMAMVMNEKGSVLQRLLDKLNLMDAIDKQMAANKMNMIIQLPYPVRNEARIREANDRTKALSEQLKNSEYGIAYADATEKIIQLNKPIENNLTGQIEYLTKMLYNQLGISEEVFNGTADEKIMLNYYTRTVEPILEAIVEELNRKFISPTARTRNQKIIYYRDPFKLVPVEQLAEMADKFTRNEILSSNEIRGLVGFKPNHDDPKNDELTNSNLYQDGPAHTEEVYEENYYDEPSYEDYGDYEDNENQNGIGGY